MDQEIEEQLVNEYPQIFRQHRLMVNSSNTSPPSPTISIDGIQCETGWAHIIQGFCEEVTKEEIDLYVTQIKEKFGGLRIYYQIEEELDDETASRLYGVVNMAKQMSLHTCEICGTMLFNSPERVRTVCDDCVN